MNVAMWKGRKVLVTGHTGFKGAWLCLLLERLGARVTGLALEPPTEPSLFALARVGDSMTSIIGDIRDLAIVTTTLRDAQPEIVIHMAAQSLVRRSYEDPVGTYATNIMGTVHLLEAVRQTPSVRVAVNVTSDKCYENRECSLGYRESDPMGGHDPYSSSKGCAELVTAAWRRSFAHSGHRPVALASARAGNVIGGGDWAMDRIVPDCMRGAMNGQVIRVRNPGAIRPWQFVLEPLRGYLMLAQRLWEQPAVFAQAWNFAPREADERPVEWIVCRLTQLWGPPARWELDKAAQPHEAHYLKLDASKARQLGWSPAIDLEQALDWTAEWYKRYHRGEDVRSVTETQIDRYLQLVGEIHPS